MARTEEDSGENISLEERWRDYPVNKRGTTALKICRKQIRCLTLCSRLSPS